MLYWLDVAFIIILSIIAIYLSLYLIIVFIEVIIKKIIQHKHMPIPICVSCGHIVDVVTIDGLCSKCWIKNMDGNDLHKVVNGTLKFKDRC